MSASAAAAAVSKRPDLTPEELAAAAWSELLKRIDSIPDRIRLSRVCKAAYAGFHGRRFVHLTGAACNQYALLSGVTKRMAEDLRRRIGYSVTWQLGTPWKLCPSYLEERPEELANGLYFGSGSFGITLLGHDLVRDRAVAIKVTPLSEHREVEVASRIGHLSHVMRPLDSCQAEDRIFQIMEIGGLGDFNLLVERLSQCSDPVVRESIVFHTISGVTKALAALHRHNYYHLDLKADNVVVDRKGRVRLIDFGCAKHSESGMLDPTLGDVRHHGPERLVGDAQFSGQKSDAFSLGLILLILLRPEYRADLNRMTTMTLLAARRVDHPELIEYVQSRIDSAIEDDRDGVTNLARALLHGEAEQRLSPADALSHPWMLRMERTVDKENIRLHLLDLASSEPTSPLELPTPWRAVHVNRTTLSVRLRAQLLKGDEPITAVVGPPGSGKSHLAQDVIHSKSIQKRFETIAWFPDCHDIDKLARWQLLLAQELGLCGAEATLREIQPQLFDYLAGRSSLLVFDDAPEPSRLQPYLPGDGVQVLLTSCHRDWRAALEVGPLSDIEASTLVKGIAGHEKQLPLSERVAERAIRAAAELRMDTEPDASETIHLYSRELPSLQHHIDRVRQFARDRDTHWMLAMALIGEKPIPHSLFRQADEIRCRLLDDLVLAPGEEGLTIHPLLRNRCVSRAFTHHTVAALIHLATLLPEPPGLSSDWFPHPELLELGERWFKEWMAVRSPSEETSSTVAARVWVLLGRAYQEGKKPDLSAALTPILLDLRHDSAPQLLNLRIERRIMGLIHDKRAREMGEVERRLGRALCQQARPDYEGAIPHFRRALDAHVPEPDLVEARLGLAVCLLGMERWAEAIVELERSLKLLSPGDPRRATASLRLAQAYIERGDDEAALRHVEKMTRNSDAVRLRREIRVRLAKEAHARSDLAAAAAYLEPIRTSLRGESGSELLADCDVHFASAAMQEEQWSRVKRNAERALGQIPGHPVANTLLAVADVSSWLAQHPQSYCETQALDDVLQRAKQIFDAHRGAKLPPEVVTRALVAQGLLCSIQSQDHEAIAYIEKGLSSLGLEASARARYQHLLALAYYRTEQHREAYDAMVPAIEYFSSQEEIWWRPCYHFGLLCKKVDPYNADTWFERALEDRDCDDTTRADRLDLIAGLIGEPPRREALLRETLGLRETIGDDPSTLRAARHLLRVLTPRSRGGEEVVDRLIELVRKVEGRNSRLEGIVLIDANNRIPPSVARAQRALWLISTHEPPEDFEVAQARLGLARAFSYQASRDAALGSVAMGLAGLQLRSELGESRMRGWLASANRVILRCKADEFGAHFNYQAGELLQRAGLRLCAEAYEQSRAFCEKRGDPLGEMRALTAVLELSFLNPVYEISARAVLVKRLEELGQFAETIPHLQQLIGKAHTCDDWDCEGAEPWAQVHLALALLETGNQQEAYRALPDSPSNAPTLGWKYPGEIAAEVLFKLGRISQAAALWRDYRWSAKTEARFALSRGLCLWHVGLDPTSDLEKALTQSDLTPKQKVECHHALGSWQVGRGDLEAGIPHLIACIQQNLPVQSLSHALLDLGRAVDERRGFPACALELLRAVLAEAPPGNLLLKARAHELLGEALMRTSEAVDPQLLFDQTYAEFNTAAALYGEIGKEKELSQCHSMAASCAAMRAKREAAGGRAWIAKSLHHSRQALAAAALGDLPEQGERELDLAHTLFSAGSIAEAAEIAVRLGIRNDDMKVLISALKRDCVGTQERVINYLLTRDSTPTVEILDQVIATGATHRIADLLQRWDVDSMQEPSQGDHRAGFYGVSFPRRPLGVTLGSAVANRLAAACEEHGVRDPQVRYWEWMVAGWPRMKFSSMVESLTKSPTEILRDIHVKRAFEQFRGEQYEAALASFRGLQEGERWPKQEWNFWIGMALALLGERAEAMKLAPRVKDWKKTPEAIAHLKSMVLGAVGRSDADALPVLEVAMAFSDTCSDLECEAVIQLATRRWGAGKRDEAIALLTRLVYSDLDGDFAERLYCLLADYRLARGMQETGAAYDDLSQGLLYSKRYPEKHAEVLVLVAKHLWERGRYRNRATARQMLEEALEILQEHPGIGIDLIEVARLLAHYQYELGDSQKALATLESVSNTSFVPVHEAQYAFLLARAKGIVSDRSEQLSRWLHDSSRSDEELEKIGGQMLSALMESGRRQPMPLWAEGYVSAARRLGSVSMLQTMGDLRFCNDQFEEAEMLYGKAGDHTPTRSRQALCQLLLGKEKPMIQQRFREIGPTDPTWLQFIASLSRSQICPPGSQSDHIRRAMDIVERQLCDDHPLVQRARIYVARQLAGIGRSGAVYARDCLKYMQRTDLEWADLSALAGDSIAALEVGIPLYGEKSPWVGEILDGLVREQPMDAAAGEQAVDIWRGENNRRKLYKALLRLAKCYDLNVQPKKIKPLIQEARSMLRELFPLPCTQAREWIRFPVFSLQHLPSQYAQAVRVMREAGFGTPCEIGYGIYITQLFFAVKAYEEAVELWDQWEIRDDHPANDLVRKLRRLLQAYVPMIRLLQQALQGAEEVEQARILMRIAGLKQELMVIPYGHILDKAKVLLKEHLGDAHPETVECEKQIAMIEQPEGPSDLLDDELKIPEEMSANKYTAEETEMWNRIRFAKHRIGFETALHETLVIHGYIDEEDLQERDAALMAIDEARDVQTLIEKASTQVEADCELMFAEKLWYIGLPNSWRAENFEARSALHALLIHARILGADHVAVRGMLRASHRFVRLLATSRHQIKEPEQVYQRFDVGRLCYLLQEYELAISALEMCRLWEEDASQFEQELGELYVWLGQTYVETGRAAEGLELLKRGGEMLGGHREKSHCDALILQAESGGGPLRCALEGTLISKRRSSPPKPRYRPHALWNDDTPLLSYRPVAGAGDHLA